MDTKNSEELMELLAKRENVGTALSIVITGNNEDFRKKIIHEYMALLGKHSFIYLSPKTI
ncbi:hypothetical protein Barb6XT_03112 [Bacteroidales bacterium Barb6XT]|nr:hypothetical protein Barb6XT_03112 [Bacteroidales bacterium Barb6XT]